jgi:hypothetical protein
MWIKSSISPHRAVAMIRPERFRFRLSTLLLVVAILALLLVVAIQQVQIGKMRRSIDVAEKAQLKAQVIDLLRPVFRALREKHERSG